MSVFKVVLFGLIFVLASVTVAGVLVNQMPDEIEEVDTQPVLVGADGNPLVPKAVVEGELEYDFGYMAPNSVESYQFEIRNDGDAPLKLVVGPKTCGCVGAKISPALVQPGEKGSVTVEWETRKWDSVEYRQGVRVLTNDPENPEFKFRAFGELKYDFRADPPAIFYPRILPGETQWQQTEIYSQIWEHFELEDLHSTLAGMEWDLQPLTKEQLAERRAKCGYRLRAKIPGDLDTGEFREHVRFRVVSEDLGNGAIDREIPLQGKVIRRLSAYGSDEYEPSRERVYLGTIQPNSPVQSRIRLFVRDEVKDLALQTIDVQPDFVKANLIQAEDPRQREKGMYYLDIEIPAGAEGNFLGADAGHVHLKFDHPRIDEFRVGLEFAVLVTN